MLPAPRPPLAAAQQGRGAKKRDVNNYIYIYIIHIYIITLKPSIHVDRTYSKDSLSLPVYDSI